MPQPGTRERSDFKTAYRAYIDNILTEPIDSAVTGGYVASEPVQQPRKPRRGLVVFALLVASVSSFSLGWYIHGTRLEGTIRDSDDRVRRLEEEVAFMRARWIEPSPPSYVSENANDDEAPEDEPSSAVSEIGTEERLGQIAEIAVKAGTTPSPPPQR